MKSGSIFFILTFLALSPSEVPFSAAQNKEAPSITCESQVCHCEPSASSSRCSNNNFYVRGGSAQAFKPGAPKKSEVCSANDGKRMRYKPASWPFGRSSRRKIPQVTVNLSLHSCVRGGADQCCCEPLLDSSNVTIEVWQTKPNGQYSSLTPGREEGVCRATLKGTTFTTLAPGSTGVLGGIGPGGWDFFPYGPPVIHVLVTSETLEPLLVHVPVTEWMNMKRPFFGPDFRGAAFVTNRITEERYLIDHYKRQDDLISMDVSLYLVTSEEPVDLTSRLCPSFLYGFPKSFFLEPIAVCAPSMMDFFNL